MGWIVAALLGFVAAIAVAMVWRKYQRDLQRLRQERDESLRDLNTEHHRRIDRLKREHHRELSTAHHPLVRDLLPALDSLDEALAFLEEDDKGSAEEIGEGIKLARQACDAVLKRHGVEIIAPDAGADFDPEIHEAIARTDAGDTPPGTVTRRFRTGYRQGDRVLRSALVEVAVAHEEEGSEEESVDEDSPPEELADEDVTPKDSDEPNRR